jgi:hypothetical protein
MEYVPEPLLRLSVSTNRPDFRPLSIGWIPLVVEGSFGPAPRISRHRFQKAAPDKFSVRSWILVVNTAIDLQRENCFQNALPRLLLERSEPTIADQSKLSQF